MLSLPITGVLQAQKVFIHPGILHSQASPDHIYKVAQEKTMAEYGAYLLLNDNRCHLPNIKVGKVNKMITGVFLPVCEKFYDTIAYTNGNWGSGKTLIICLQ